MSDNKNKRKKEVFSAAVRIATIVLLAVLSGVFLFLFVDGGKVAFLTDHAALFKIFGSVVLALLCVMAIVFQLVDNDFVVRLVLTVVVFAAIILTLLYVLQLVGFWDKVSSIDELRAYIADFGSYAVIATVIMQILQVVVLPIPGVVAIGAAVALFGPFKGGVISFIGIMTGSVICFFIGRVFGYKAASWLVGKEALDKGLESVKGKDKVILTFMFIFPFFPDDVLCFVAGLSSMSKRYYLIMIMIARLVSVFTTAYSVNGSIIPYNTWWGIVIWMVLIAAVGLISWIVYKNGVKIENWFKKRFSGKRDEKVIKDAAAPDPQGKGGVK
ncbi:MAG: TVP38/TMEM64 family protein [Clostridia bacterium]|nr:TVP38/TMEM64 family protein [Clostridia bacterium]